MLTMLENQTIPENDNSRKRIWFKCTCGRQKQIMWKNYKTNHTKSCGECRSDKYKIANIINKQWGSLTLNAQQSFPEKVNSKTTILWDCVCGQQKVINIGSVVTGLTKSCGCIRQKPTGRAHIKPILISKSVWLQEIPQLVDDDLPDMWSKAVRRLFKFKCICGNIYVKKFGKWKSTSKCGLCDYQTGDSLIGKEYGNLKIIVVGFATIHKNSDHKVTCECKCGNTKQISLSALNRGQRTCGECNLRSKQWWMAQTFGHLKVYELENDMKLFSEEKIKCVCTCGNICYKEASCLVNGITYTCGSCYERGMKFWQNKPSIVRYSTKSMINKYSLDYLIDYFRGSYIQPLENANALSDYNNFKCLLCGNIFKTKLIWIHESKIISCGCINNKVTKPVMDICDSLGLEFETEFKLNSYKYDIKCQNLLIEYHGLRYHSEFRNTRGIDEKKYLNAINGGYDYMLIYEDEWQYKKDLVLKMIQNKLNINNVIVKLRPKQCEIKITSNREISAFYKEHHYIGSCNSAFNMALMYNNQIVACLSLRKPVRQSNYDFEISRMAQHSEFKVHGVWSFLFSKLKDYDINGRIVTYSDNRLFNGAIYQKLGFKYDGAVRADYYWVKNNKRYHKSNLRKPKGTIITESELRSSQGYKKIYDLGKKRWIIVI